MTRLIPTLALAVFVAACSDPPPSVDQRTRAAAMISEMRTSGLLVTFDCADSHDAYVQPGLWALIDHAQKENATTALAIDCQVTTGHRYVHVKDNQSGTEIARFYGGAYESLR